MSKFGNEIVRFLQYWIFFVFLYDVNGSWINNQIWGGPGAITSYSCGQSFSSKIIGGIYANPHEFRWMAALLRSARGQSQKYFYCGGTIISKRYVTTAAHCLSSTVVMSVSDITVRVGAYNLQQGNLYQRDFQIRYVVRHPSNDVAILQTNAAMQWSLGVGAVCLPFRNRDNKFEYNNATIVGWGALGQSSPNSAILRKARTIVQTNESCNRWSPQYQLRSFELCTFQPNIDSCSSDSGGPVLSVGSRKFLIGIISGGGVCSMSVGVNVRITSHLDWIRDTVLRLDYATNLQRTNFEEYPM